MRFAEECEGLRQAIVETEAAFQQCLEAQKVVVMCVEMGRHPC